MEWLGKSECDLCKENCTEYLVDGKIPGGSWGVFHVNCFNMMGGVIGIGFGQLYEYQGGKWIKVQG